MKYMDGIVPVMNVGGSNNNGNNSFDGNNGWWIILVLLFALGGNNWGNRGGNSGNGDASSVLPYLMARDTTGGSLTRGDLCMDMNFNDLQNAVRNGVAENNSNFRTIDNAICTLGYDNLVQASGINMNIANGFSRLDTNLCQSFNNVAQQLNGLSNQLSNCCCDLKTGQLENTYALTTTINNVYNQLHNEITANRIEDKNAQITAQQNEINALRLSASQAAQNEYLLNQLRNGCPVNAQLVCGNQPIPVQYIGAGFNCGFNRFNEFGSCGCN